MERGCCGGRRKVKPASLKNRLRNYEPTQDCPRRAPDAAHLSDLSDEKIFSKCIGTRSFDSVFGRISIGRSGTPRWGTSGPATYKTAAEEIAAYRIPVALFQGRLEVGSQRAQCEHGRRAGASDRPGRR